MTTVERKPAEAENWHCRIRHISEILWANRAATDLFGPVRGADDTQRLVDELSDEDKEQRRKLAVELMKVSS